MNPERFESGHDRKRIHTTWEREVLPYVADEEMAAAVFDVTLVTYSDEDRYYHNLSHIASCVDMLDPYRGREDYQKLFLALLWHDVVYDTARTDNEELSAEKAVTFMDGLGLDGAEDVSRMIISTKEHATDVEDEQLVCAIDMSILAEPFPIYLAYTKGIREEYRKVAPIDSEFYDGRLTFLNRLSRKQVIFQHPDFVHLNGVADMNVRHEKALLASKL